jgi:hypothetical protein
MASVMLLHIGLPLHGHEDQAARQPPCQRNKMHKVELANAATDDGLEGRY